MLKKIIGIFICTLMIASVFVFPINAEHEINIKEKNESFVFSEPNLIEENNYIKIDFNEATSYMMIPGNPILPIFTKVFTFPFGTKIKEVKCNPSVIKEKIIFKEIIACPEPVSAGSTGVFVGRLVKNQEVYLNNDFYPDFLYNYRIGCGLYGGELVVLLTIGVYPVRYSPGLNLIEYIESVELDVVYEEPSRPILANDEYDMIIITPAEFSDELEPLVSYKNPFTVTKLFTLDEIPSGVGMDTQEDIKYFIKQAIEDRGVSYVLLVGGSDQLPVRKAYVNDSIEECFISDLYYADIYDSNGDFCSWDSNGNGKYAEYEDYSPLDIVDLYPDVCLGRLPCTKESEVINVVNKIINYDGAYYEDWFKNIVVCGGDSADDYGEYINEGEYLNQAVLDIMDGFFADKIWASNGGLDNYININNAIEKGAGFVCFSGHGTNSNWITHPPMDWDVWIPPGGYTTYRIGWLSNGNMLPVITADGCCISDFESNKECWSWKFITNTKGGSVATTGFTGIGWGYVGSWTTEGLGGLLHLNLYNAYAQKGVKILGNIWATSIYDYLNDLLYYMGAHDYKDIEAFELFGDPTLLMDSLSIRPNKPVIDGPTKGETKKIYTYTTNTTDIEGDQLYYLFDWGDGKNSGWIGPLTSGESASANYSWTNKGIFLVRSRAKDIKGAVSDWSETLIVTIPKSKAINTSFIQFLQNFIGNYPNLFLILQKIIQRLGLL